jgi:hypothetical protein
VRALPGPPLWLQDRFLQRRGAPRVGGVRQEGREKQMELGKDEEEFFPSGKGACQGLLPWCAVFSPAAARTYNAEGLRCKHFSVLGSWSCAKQLDTDQQDTSWPPHESSHIRCSFLYRSDTPANPLGCVWVPCCRHCPRCCGGGWRPRAAWGGSPQCRCLRSWWRWTGCGTPSTTSR